MARKICNICNTRPVDRAAGIQDACVPCYEEGGWENSHQDNGHEELAELREQAKTAGAVELRKLAGNRLIEIKNASKHKSAELRQMILDKIEAECFGCWICHPELNEAQKQSAPKQTRRASEGPKISRKGQKITVPLIAPGEVKAAVVIEAAGEERAKLSLLGGGVAVLDVNLGDGMTLHLAWDSEGRYDYPEAYVSMGGKKKAVRNVAEALRIVKASGK